MEELPAALLAWAADAQAFAKGHLTQVIAAVVLLAILAYVITDLVAYFTIPSVYVDPSEGVYLLKGKTKGALPLTPRI